MANNLVIVAIPSADDYSRRISSEKVPHMTLLYLGEGIARPNAQRIVDFLEHAAKTSLTRFGMEVNRRGTLGDEDADVLFFDKRWSHNVEEFRAALLKDSTIRDAYDSVEQYPEWTPHLTLGYPSSPAKPDTRDYPGIGWVNFDRVALWTGDYDGPEFRLEENSGMDVAYHATAARGASFLEHYGVKGMKWGVRRAASQLGAARPKSDDALVANAAKRKARVKGLDSLSNKELKDLSTRLNLETQVSSLSKKRNTLARGSATVASVIAAGATVNSAIAFSKTPAGKLIAKQIAQSTGGKLLRTGLATAALRQAVRAAV